MLTSLKLASDQSEVKLLEFSLSPGEIATDSSQLKTISTSDGQTALEVEVELEGTFANVQNFMNTLEKVAPFTTITKISLETPDTTTTEAQESEEIITASLITQTYFFARSVTTTVEEPLPKVNSRQQAVIDQLRHFEAIVLPLQTEIQGGGLEDLFGLPGIFGQTSPQQVAPSPSPTVGSSQAPASPRPTAAPAATPTL